MVLLAVLAFLSFPTVAVFVSLIAAGYALALAIRRRSLGGSGVWAGGRLALVLAAGWLLAIWAYYGLYISPVLTLLRLCWRQRPGRTPP